MTNNIMPFKQRKKKPPPSLRTTPPKEPMLNLPRGVKSLCSILLLVYLALEITSHLFNPTIKQTILLNWAFIPARFSGEFTFLAYTILTPITYTLFHGGLFHLLINTIMLLAFGSGFEKNFGTTKLMVTFWGSSLIAALAHFIIDFQSMVPMVGASGGISGLFAGLLLTMQRSGQLSPNQKLFPIVLVFIGISFLFGLFNSSGGNSVAWAAHIGGFVGGLLITHIILKRA